jgi:signal transduction histidine kinase
VTPGSACEFWKEIKKFRTENRAGSRFYGVKRPSLADELARGKEVLLLDWRQRVQGTVDPEGATIVEIIDGVPTFIDELVAMLRGQEESTGVAPDSARANELAVDHGSQRFHAGFSLGAVIREYDVLRECLLDLIRDRRLAVDIDELQVMMDTLNAAVVNAAEQYVRERDQLIERQSQTYFGFIAHELRNPLGSALLAAHVLQRRNAPQSDATVARLVRNLAILRDLIDDSLSSVRIQELGRNRSLDVADISLHGMVLDVRDELSGDTEEKAISVRIDGEAAVQGDPRLIRSAVTNLLRNAAKYTRRGGTIDVRIRSDHDLTSIEIEDECGGLPDGKTEELFTPFVQRGGDRSGFGLGLAITKDAVEAHHGTVQASNLPGKGCIFMASFPVRATSSPDSASTSRAPAWAARGRVAAAPPTGRRVT